MARPLIIGSRGSKLALWQAEQARERLRDLNPQLDVHIEIIKTTGDVKTDPLSVIGGKGVFTKELEDALLDGRIDLAVHSLKDLPTILPDGLSIAAICEREDPRDALVLRAGVENGSLLHLPDGAVVGTSSQRRLAQLKALRSDVVVRDLRGNVDTRIRKLDEGQYDAVILASAGLVRLGLQERISARIAIDDHVGGHRMVVAEHGFENEAIVVPHARQNRMRGDVRTRDPHRQLHHRTEGTDDRDRLLIRRPVLVAARRALDFVEPIHVVPATLPGAHGNPE